MSEHPPQSAPPHWPLHLKQRVGPVRAWRFLGQGTSRRAWQVSTEQAELVWRVPLAERPPGSDPAREFRVLRWLSNRPEVPDLLWSGSLGDSIVTFSPGRPADLEHCSDRLRRKMLAFLDRLWTESGPVAAWHYPDLLADYAGIAGTESARLRAAELAAAWRQWPDVAPVMVHHDLQADNVLVSPDGSGFSVLDWEYAAPGNPWLDAVVLARWCPLTAAEKQWLEKRLAPWCPTGVSDPFAWYETWVRGLAALWEQAAGTG